MYRILTKRERTNTEKSVRINSDFIINKLTSVNIKHLSDLELLNIENAILKIKDELTR